MLNINIKNNPWFRSNRFIFENPPEAPRISSETPSAVIDPRDEVCNEEGPIAKQLRKEQREADIEDSRQQQQELKEAKEAAEDESPASLYLETFKKSPKLPTLASIIEYGKDSGDPEGVFDFGTWPAAALESPDRAKWVMAIFAEPSMPKGKGWKAFLKGLEIGPPAEGSDKDSKEAQEFLESHRVLQEIVQHLDKYLADRKKTNQDLNSLAAKHPLGFTVGDATRTLRKNWERSDVTDKGLMLGGGATLLWLAYSYWNQPIPGTGGKLKWSSLIKGIAGFYAVNYFAGKMSKSGRTPVQKFLEVTQQIDDFKDNGNPLKGFAEKHGMRKNQEKFKTYITMRDIDVKTLFPLYDQARRTNREIDPTKLNFHKNEIDPKYAYEVMDDLVKDTSVNIGKEGSGIEKPTPDLEAKWRREWIAVGAFHDKYIAGELGAADMPFWKAVTNEMSREEAKVVNDKASSETLPSRAYEAAKDVTVNTVYKRIKDYGKATGTWIAGAAGATYEFGQDSVVAPLWSRAKGVYRHFKPDVLKPYYYVREKQAELQEQDLKKVFPPDFSPEVPKAGFATIMGFPGIPFEVRYRESDGVEVAIVEGDLPFVLKDGPGGKDNMANAAILKKRVETKVQALIDEKAKTISELKGKHVEWRSDPKDKKFKWYLKGITINGNPAIGLGPFPGDIGFEIEEDGKTVRFLLIGKEIPEGEWRDREKLYLAATIEKVIETDARPEFKFLKGLPVKVTSITPGPPSPIIVGTIGGLNFSAVLKPGKTSITDGLDFYDAAATPPRGGLERLKIEQANGGPEFLEALADNINRDPYFNNIFLQLASQIENADESVMSHLDKFMKGDKIWIIPKDVKGLYNGRILKHQWAYTLNFKRQEVLHLFLENLQGKTGDEIPIAYKDSIQDAVDDLTKLSRYIASRSDEYKAKEFHTLLRGPGVGRVPAGLEYINYTNAAYRALFQEYQRMIAKYDYEGFDNLDSSIAENSYEIYETLLRVWSFATRKYAKVTTLIPATEKFIRFGVIDKVRQKLDLAAAGGKVVSKVNLPPSVTEDDLKKWL